MGAAGAIAEQSVLSGGVPSAALQGQPRASAPLQESHAPFKFCSGKVCILKFARFSPLGIAPSEDAKKIAIASAAPRTHFENSIRPV